MGQWNDQFFGYIEVNTFILYLFYLSLVLIIYLVMWSRCFSVIILRGFEFACSVIYSCLLELVIAERDFVTV